MPYYTFTSHSGISATVDAIDEASARVNAMEAIWGPERPLRRPNPWTGERDTIEYIFGSGLYLERIEPCQA